MALSAASGMCLVFATTSVYLYLPYHLPKPSWVNLVSVSQRSCLNFSGRVLITKFAFFYCDWANNSSVTLSLPPGRLDLVNLAAKFILWISSFYRLRF